VVSAVGGRAELVSLIKIVNAAKTATFGYPYRDPLSRRLA
jgi:hypothetical protein